LPRKKSKTELCIDPNELLCPPVLMHKYPILNQT
uniref:Ovule protein n=1 Tax=Heligmosomoides polygyrus TaxID=6339 RepID=A0A183FAB2_HELPZ